MKIKMNKNRIFTLMAISSIIVLFSYGCKKEPGLGGNATIIGKLKTQNYNSDFSILIEEHYTSNEYVYIVFGNSPGYGDRVKTSFDGTFMFEHLLPGEYTVYAYSKDTAKIYTNDVAILKNVTVSKKELKDIGEIVIADNKAKGYSRISGRVLMHDTGNSSDFYISDQKVYIVYNNNIAYDTYTRTNFDGFYEFTNLVPGHYTVYTYSKDINNISPDTKIPVKYDLDITNTHQDTTLMDLEIYK